MVIYINAYFKEINGLVNSISVLFKWLNFLISFDNQKLNPVLIQEEECKVEVQEKSSKLNNKKTSRKKERERREIGTAEMERREKESPLAKVK